MTNTKKYTVRRCELTRAETRSGLVPAWCVVRETGRDYADIVLDSLDTREIARYEARLLNEGTSPHA